MCILILLNIWGGGGSNVPPPILIPTWIFSLDKSFAQPATLISEKHNVMYLDYNIW